MKLSAELQAYAASARQKTPTEVSAAMDLAHARLASSGLVDRALRRGERMPDFELPDANGKLVKSGDMRQQAMLLISFYRGGWCPYCSLELRALQEWHAEIVAAGATLVAISPQTPDYSLTTQQKNELEFPVLSDLGSIVARRFGLAYSLDEGLRPVYKAFGVDLEARNGDTSFELPVTATYLIAKDGTVLEAFVDIDYRSRLEPEVALAWIERAKR